MDRIDMDGVNWQPQKKIHEDFRFRVFISPFTDVECDSVDLDAMVENTVSTDKDCSGSEAQNESTSGVAESETMESETVESEAAVEIPVGES